MVTNNKPFLESSRMDHLTLTFKIFPEHSRTLQKQTVTVFKLILEGQDSSGTDHFSKKLSWKDPEIDFLRMF